MQNKLYRVFMRYVSTEIAVLVAFGSWIFSNCINLYQSYRGSSIPWSINYLLRCFTFYCDNRVTFLCCAPCSCATTENAENISPSMVQELQELNLQSLASSSRLSCANYPTIIHFFTGAPSFWSSVMSFEEAAENFEALEIDFLLLTMPRQHLLSETTLFPSW